MFYCFLQFLALAERTVGSPCTRVRVHHKTRVPQYQAKAKGPWKDVTSYSSLPFRLQEGVAYRLVLFEFYNIFINDFLCSDFKSWRSGQMASGLPDPLLTPREGDGSSGEVSSAGASGTEASSDHQARAPGSQEVFGNYI